MILDDEKAKLFKQIRVKLGGQIRKVELTDDDLCTLLEVAIGNYAEVVQGFIIESNWSNLLGKKVGFELSNSEIVSAISTRSFEITKYYGEWFSKEHGLNQNSRSGKWVLNKDFIKLENGKSNYYIQPNRQICKVMWVTPPPFNPALFSGLGTGTFAFGPEMGYAQMGGGSMLGFGNGAYGTGLWAYQATDVVATYMDASFKNQLFGNELIYRVTAAPDGGQILHLLSTPGNRHGLRSSLSLDGCYLWYTYYDTNPDNADDCKKDNFNVIVSPEQVRLDSFDYSQFNDGAKNVIRSLLFSEACSTLALIRGKFSGAINSISSSLTLDYAMLMNLSKEYRDSAINDLKERMARLMPNEVMKRNAELVRDMKVVQSGTPLKFYVI